MGDKTKIEWCDATFNPWIGCTKVSTAEGGGGGCDNCYAEEQDSRGRWDGGRKHWGAGVPRYRTAKSTWAQALTWNRAHDAFYAKHGRRQRVFCASLADIFDNEVSNTWRADLIGLVCDTPNLDWLWLTKRIGNVPRLMEECTEPGHDWKLPPNVWLGITVVNQMEADRDIPKLLAIKACVRFLSCEPLLGPIDLAPWLWGRSTPCATCPRDADCACGYETRDKLGEPALGWVIGGGESGPKARPSHPDWHRSLRDQCAAAGVPFLFKQWGAWRPPIDGEPFDTSQGEAQKVPSFIVGRTGTCHCFHNDATFGSEPMLRVGKKAAGRALDGLTHDGFPA